MSLVGHLHHGDVDAPGMKIFGHLQADEACAHDQGGFDLSSSTMSLMRSVSGMVRRV